MLYEGYVLYPYRASAQKNQMRWQFGVLAPGAYAEATGSERSTCRTECVVDPGADPRVTVRVRCLQVQRRIVEARDQEDGFAGVAELDVDGERFVPWEEAVEHELDLADIGLFPFADVERTVDRHLAGSDTVEELRAADGQVVGRVRRRCEPVDAVVRVRADWADTLGIHIKVVVEVENVTGWSEPDAPRDVAMRHSLVAVHTLLAVDDGDFVSLLDPSDDARRRGRRLLERGHVPGARRRRRHASCSRHRSSSTTTPKSRPRATARSTTRPRSTRSSRSGCSR